MSDAVMASMLALSASGSQGSIAVLFNAWQKSLRHKARVLGSKEILDELARRKVERSEIAEVLGIHPSQVTRLYETDKKPRQLKHDEAVKLVARYGLETPPQASSLPWAVWRVVAHHASLRLGLSLDENDPRLQAVASDLAAFSRFVRNPRVQGTLEAAQHFFLSMESARPEAELADRSETTPQPSR